MIMAAVLFGVAGLTVGSFLNVIIDRLPQGRSVVLPASHCEACEHKLSAIDLVPVFSYLFLLGRCRHCGAAIPRRVPLVELVTGLVFAYLWLRYGFSLQLLAYVVYAGIFITVFVIDLEQGIIPDRIVYPGMILALLFSIFVPGSGVVWSLVGGGVGFVIMFLPYLLSRGGMGGGDVKFGALMGLVVAFPSVLLGLFLAIAGGGMVAAALLALRLRTRKEAIPFGPFLAGGAAVALLWGPDIMRWYLGLF